MKPEEAEGLVTLRQIPCRSYIQNVILQHRHSWPRTVLVIVQEGGMER